MPTPTEGLPEGAVMIPRARLSYHSLFEKRAYDSKDTPKYDATFLIPPKSPAIQELRDAVAEVKGKGKLKGISFYPPDEDDKERPEGCEGYYRLTAKTSGRPMLLTREAEVLDSTDDSPFYGGCWVRAAVSPWLASKASWVSFELAVVQFAADGDRFGGGVNKAKAAQAFTAIEDDDESVFGD